MFKFLILANALVAIVKMVSPTEPERVGVYFIVSWNYCPFIYIFFEILPKKLFYKNIPMTTDIGSLLH